MKETLSVSKTKCYVHKESLMFAYLCVAKNTQLYRYELFHVTE